jgi:hypothetical protein
MNTFFVLYNQTDLALGVFNEEKEGNVDHEESHEGNDKVLCFNLKF